MVKKVFRTTPLVLAALALALAFASCDKGNGPAGVNGPDIQHGGATGILTVTGLEDFAGGEISVSGDTDDGINYFFHYGEVAISAEGTATIELLRMNILQGFLPVAWADMRVNFDIDIYDAEGSQTMAHATVTFSGGRATLAFSAMTIY